MKLSRRPLTAATSLAIACWLALPAPAQVQFPIRTSGGSGTGFQHGFSVAGVGDLNGDGRSEYMVGEPNDGLTNTPGVATYRQGTAILFDGATGVVLQQDYGSFAAGSTEDHLGNCVAGIGDVTGDGIPDFAAGATQGLYTGLANPRPNGYVRFYNGATLTAPPALPTPMSVINLGFVPAGFNPKIFGRSIASVPDVDGDGVPDVAIGAPGDFSPGGASGLGSVYVYSGASLATTPVLLYNVPGPNFASDFGESVAGFNDLDLDGFGDFLVGSPGNIVPGPSGGVGDGSAMLFSGATGAQLFQMNGVAGAFQRLGQSVGNAGDISANGSEELLIGAPNASSPGSPGLQDGAAYVVEGKLAAIGTLLIQRTYRGFLDIGVAANTRLGYSCAGAGDIDGDGTPDQLVGGPGDHFFDPDAIAPPGTWNGAVAAVSSGTGRIYSGATGALLKVYWGTEATGTPGTNPGNFAGIGVSIASAGDTDGDGVPDVVIGGSGWNAGGTSTNRGKAYLYAGKYTFGNKYGVANTNTFGVAADISASGSLSVVGNQLVLTVTGLPPGTTCIPFFGPTPNMAGTPVSNGIIYVAGTLTRLPSVFAGPAGPTGTGTATITVDLTSPAVAPLITPFTEWYFQVQYRNSAAGPGVTNMCDAINLGFLP
jgi:hypothetical protein